PAALLELGAPAVLRAWLDEGDELEVGAVGEADQRIVAADRVATAAHDGEAERLVVGDGSVEVGDHDDDMIETAEHGYLLGATRPPSPGRGRVSRPADEAARPLGGLHEPAGQQQHDGDEERAEDEQVEIHPA